MDGGPPEPVEPRSLVHVHTCAGSLMDRKYAALAAHASQTRGPDRAGGQGGTATGGAPRRSSPRPRACARRGGLTRLFRTGQATSSRSVAVSFSGAVTWATWSAASSTNRQDGSARPVPRTAVRTRLLALGARHEGPPQIGFAVLEVQRLRHRRQGVRRHPRDDPRPRPGVRRHGLGEGGGTRHPSPRTRAASS